MYGERCYLKLVECRGGERTTLAFGPSWGSIKEKMEGAGQHVRKKMNQDASTTILFLLGMSIWYGVFDLLLQYRFC